MWWHVYRMIREKNYKKTKQCAFRFCQGDGYEEKWTPDEMHFNGIDATELKITDSFKFIGSVVSVTTSSEKGWTNRIQIRGKCYIFVRDLLFNRKLSWNAIRRTGITCYISVLTYGCELCNTMKKMIEELRQRSWICQNYDGKDEMR